MVVSWRWEKAGVCVEWEVWNSHLESRKMNGLRKCSSMRTHLKLVMKETSFSIPLPISGMGFWISTRPPPIPSWLGKVRVPPCYLPVGFQWYRAGGVSLRCPVSLYLSQVPYNLPLGLFPWKPLVPFPQSKLRCVIPLFQDYWSIE